MVKHIVVKMIVLQMSEVDLKKRNHTLMVHIFG